MLAPMPLSISTASTAVTGLVSSVTATATPILELDLHLLWFTLVLLCPT